MQNEKEHFKYNLFLDDIRMPVDAWLYTKKFVYKENSFWNTVRSYDEFVKKITSIYKKHGILPVLISFDHDLADEHYAPEEHWNNYDSWEEQQKFLEKTGYHCAVWLTEFCMDNNLKLPDYMCHSMNPRGHEKILGLLDNFKKHQNS